MYSNAKETFTDKSNAMSLLFVVFRHQNYGGKGTSLVVTHAMFLLYTCTVERTRHRK